jgi:dTDP-4-dehydrorhamnose reductase
MSSKTEKVLVLGASGRLGRELCRALELHGHLVSPHSTTGPEGLRADVLVAGSIRSLISRQKPSVIINTIALTDVDQCEQDPSKSDLVNVGPTREISEYLDASHHPRVLHISTDHVYGTAGPHAEHDVHILNRYASDKYRAERVVLDFDGVVLRTNFFGKSLDPARPSYSDWLVTSARSGREFSVSDQIQFNPLRMRTLASVIHEVMVSEIHGIYNIGATTSMTKFEFATRFLSAVGKDLAEARLSRNDRDPVVPRPIDMRMDVSRIQYDLAIELPSLMSEVKDEAEVYRNER